MKKSLLAFVLPVFLTVACSLAVWAYEPGVTPPRYEGVKNTFCDVCAQAGKTQQGCDNCAKLQAEGKPWAAGNFGNCGQMQEGKPCCGNCEKMKQLEKKPCCDKNKPQ